MSGLIQPYTTLLERAAEASGLPQHFRGDYSEVLWVTSSQARAQQVERGLQRELLRRGGGGMLPPRVLPWHRAASLLALMHLGDHPEPALNVEWPELWLEQALRPLARAVLDPEADEAVAMNDAMRAAQVKNLAADLRTFVARVVLLDRASAVDLLAASPPALPATAHWFLRAWQRYRALTTAETTAGKEPFSALEAIRRLLVEAQRAPLQSPLVVLVEDTARMEPMVEQLFETIQFRAAFTVRGGGPPPGPSVRRSIVLKSLDSGSPTPSELLVETRGPASRLAPATLRRMMTPLDEAGAVAARVRAHLARCAARSVEEASDDLVVVCAREGLRGHLALLFERYGLVTTRTVPLGTLPEFRVLEVATRLAWGGSDDTPPRPGRDLRLLVTSPASRFRLGDDGLRRLPRVGVHRFGAEGAQADGLITSAAGFDELDVARAAALSSCLRAPSSLTQLARDLLAVPEDRAEAVRAIFDLAERIDRLRALPADEDVVDEPDRRALTLLSRCATQEVPAPNRGAPTGHYVPIVRPVEALSLEARVVLLCGLDASFDTPRASCAPLPLLKAAGIPGGRELQRADAEAVRTLFRTAPELHLSHAWLDDSGKVAGQSLLLHEFVGEGERAVSVLPEPGEGLLTVDDILDELLRAPPASAGPRDEGGPSRPTGAPDWHEAVAVPDPSYAPRGGVAPVELDSGLTRWLDRTPLDLLRELKPAFAGGAELSVRVTELATVAECPRRYVLNQVTEVLGLSATDPAQQRRMDRGTLWHALLETAGQDRRFIQRDEAQLRASLLEAAEQVADARAALCEAAYSGGRDHFLREAREVALGRFVAREIERQTRRGTVRVEVEHPVSWSWPSRCSPGLSFQVKARLDRVDTDADGLAHVWDYKTGSAKRSLPLVQAKKSPKGIGFYSAQPRYTAQLALYLHLLAQANTHRVTADSQGALITLDGLDSLPPPPTPAKGKSRAKPKTAGYSTDVEQVVLTLLAEFDELLHAPLHAIVLRPAFRVSRSARVKNAPAGRGNACRYCEYVPFCRVPSVALNGDEVEGLGTDDEGGADA